MFNANYQLQGTIRFAFTQVFQFTDALSNSEEGEGTMELIIQMRVWGLPVTPQDFSLFTQEMEDTQLQTTTTTAVVPETSAAAENQTEEETETWMRELFQNDPWFDTEYLCSDMSFILTDTYLMITGYVCNCFIVWSLITRAVVKKVMFPIGAVASHKVNKMLALKMRSFFLH